MSLGRFVEKIGSICQTVIAELLGDALGIWALGTLFDEVIEEAQDLEVKAFQTVILIIVQLLSDRVVIALQEILALLI